jgi:hypothetical protein
MLISEQRDKKSSLGLQYSQELSYLQGTSVVGSTCIGSTLDRAAKNHKSTSHLPMLMGEQREKRNNPTTLKYEEEQELISSGLQSQESGTEQGHELLV